MTQPYPYEKAIDLFVKGRIPEQDAQRQMLTAQEILHRFARQPGLILADEVGMGKTFVALAVAVSVALADTKRRPVVVMVPPSLQKKWPDDFAVFREKCLPPDIAKRLEFGTAHRAIAFLKLLDDPKAKRKSIIFLTHGAMSHGLKDPWVKLALIYQSLRNRRGANDMRSLLCQRLGELLHLKWVEKRSTDVWWDLLHTDPSGWLSVLREYGIDPENDANEHTDDDPVPAAVCEILPSLNTDSVYESLRVIPQRESKYYSQRLKDARSELQVTIRDLWKECIQKLHIRLPLLILDEAHHLKNPDTRLASLFQVKEAQEDMEEISQGPLGGVFERMLFLTATPFQLGHRELCSVLQRFDGINWSSRKKPSEDRKLFQNQLKELGTALDQAQEFSHRLEKAWGKMRESDLKILETEYSDVAAWWESAQNGDGLTPSAEYVLRTYQQAQERMRHAESLLHPWVIRHLRSRQFSQNGSSYLRRLTLPGQAILQLGNTDSEQGILIEGQALLPFLLAARASDHAPDSRPVFAEGLASSYEAFLETRSENQKASHTLQDEDEEEEQQELLQITEAMHWYLYQLDQLVPRQDRVASAQHPKISATVQRALDLWRHREKVLIFCHYRATGRTLRDRVQDAIQDEIVQMGNQKMNCEPCTVLEQLELMGNRFFDTDSPIRLACDQIILELLKPYTLLQEHWEVLVNVVRRFVRTPTFLVRYFDLSQERLTGEVMEQALETPDQSVLTLRQLLRDFLNFLVERCGESDREEFLKALEEIQPGRSPNVRLINGATKQDIRRKLLLTFNTPFYPEVLIASSVMAEGVDLHLNCRHIIHHDLCWNPSTLEQRTGRVDRIGGKVERCGAPIHVYLPYIAETQDEKMYRVVMDRQRWFNVVMGEKYKVDMRTTDKIAARISLPEAAAMGLAFKLDVKGDDVGKLHV